MSEILIIDDNLEILTANHEHLTSQGFSVTSANTGNKAITFLKEKPFDCIVLDVMLPDMDGFAICKAARKLTQAPIIFLSCLDDIDDKLQGLMSGGDDYMTKPYSLKELAGRIKAMIRRTEMNHEPPTADFYVEHTNRMLHTPQKTVILSQKEYDLFMLFYRNPNRLFSKEEILETIWKNSVVDVGTVAVHVLKLRKKISFAERYFGQIETNYGNGYLLVVDQMEADK